LKIYEDIFGFLFIVKKLKSLNYTFLKEKCLNVENLRNKIICIDGFDLFSELNILRKIIGLKNDKSDDILSYIKRINYFPNV